MVIVFYQLSYCGGIYMIKEVLALNIQPTLTDPHHRFNSWKHCYHFFKENHARLNEEAIQDTAALHLRFYLTSWGMMRGSTDLLQKDY